MPPLDKQAHFWAGAAIAASVALYTTPALGLVAAIFAAAAKELWDYAGHGTPDFNDFLATVAGSAVVIPLIM